MQIVLVRHGQPAWSDGTVAFNDPGLTELGQEQAARMAERIAAMGEIDHLLVSPMVRARQTVAPLEERLDRTATVLDWLHEIRLPDSWDGAPIERVSTVFRDARTRDRDEWWEPVAPGAEPFGQFQRRVTDGTDEYLADLGVEPHRRDPEAVWHLPADDAGRIVIVAHAGTNSAILGRLLGIEPRPWEWERFASAHASVSLLSTTEIGPGWIFALDRFSGTRHLDGLEVTR